MQSMSIAALFSGIVALPDGIDASIQVNGLALNSQQVDSGYLFFALSGAKQTGMAYVGEAVAKGVAVVVCESENTEVMCDKQQGAFVLAVPDLKAKLGLIAARFYGEPAQSLKCIGVTGTNGKSSIAYCLSQALTALQHPCGMIGTLGWGIPGALSESSMTTPDAIALQSQLATLKHQGASHLAMEVSSHALAQGRVVGLTFDVGVLTNITRDHLDYHGSMAEYKQAKMQLFAKHCSDVAIVNWDDPVARSLMKAVPKHLRLLTYSTQDPMADIVAQALQSDLSGIRTQVKTPWGQTVLSSGLVGRFNASNLLGALAVLGSLGLPLDAASQALGQAPNVPGRMQQVPKRSGQPTAMIDYAHTPDALQKALEALRAFAPRRLICVFGCGGDRDKGKRPLMGRIAESLSDQCIITDDNPRSESPEVIAQAIVSGMMQPLKAEIIQDRSHAIAKAIASGQEDDVILIAGKGHERTQAKGEHVLLFDDFQVAKGILSAEVIEV